MKYLKMLLKFKCPKCDTITSSIVHIPTKSISPNGIIEIEHLNIWLNTYYVNCVECGEKIQEQYFEYEQEPVTGFYVKKKDKYTQLELETILDALESKNHMTHAEKAIQWHAIQKTKEMLKGE